MIGVGLLQALITNAVIPQISLYIYLFSSLRKSIAFMYDDCSVEYIL